MQGGSPVALQALGRNPQTGGIPEGNPFRQSSIIAIQQAGVMGGQGMDLQEHGSDSFVTNAPGPIKIPGDGHSYPFKLHLVLLQGQVGKFDPIDRGLFGSQKISGTYQQHGENRWIRAQQTFKSSL
jgi:hypothetical protein